MGNSGAKSSAAQHNTASKAHHKRIASVDMRQHGCAIVFPCKYLEGLGSPCLSCDEAKAEQHCKPGSCCKGLMNVCIGAYVIKRTVKVVMRGCVVSGDEGI